jgi:hypothetical protein
LLVFAEWKKVCCRPPACVEKRILPPKGTGGKE